MTLEGQGIAAPTEVKGDPQIADETPAAREGVDEAARNMEPGSSSSAGSQITKDSTISCIRHACILTSASLFCLVIGYDFSAVSSILPTIGVDLFNQSIINFVAIVFVVALAAMLPISMKLGDMFGHRTVFVLFALMHIVGVFMSGAAKKMPLLLAGRAVSGIGAAGTVITSIIAVSRLGNKKQRDRGLLIVLGFWLLGSILGFAVGSCLASLKSWKWVFYVEAPFLIVTSLVGIMAFNIPRSAEPESLLSKFKRMDILGWLLLAGCVVSLILALNQGQNVFAWISGVVIGILILAALLLVGFVVAERYVATDRILPSNIIKSKASGLMLFVQLFSGMAIYPPLLYQITWYHVVKNVSAKSAALYVMPSAIVTLVSALATMLILSFWKKTRVMVGISMAFMLLGIGLLISLNQNTRNALPAVYMALFGIGVGMSVQPHILLFREISAETTENVVGSFLFARFIGAAIGIAIFNTAFQNVLTTKLAETVLSHLLFTKYILDSPDNEDVMRLSVVPQSVRNEVAKDNSQALRIAFIANMVYIALATVLCLPLILKHLFRNSTTRRRHCRSSSSSINTSQ